MHVMTNDPHEREHTTTQDKSTQGRVNPKALVTEDQDFLREIVREALQQIPRGGDTNAPGAESKEHTESRQSHCQVLGVELAGRESRTSRRDFPASFRERGLHGVEFVVLRCPPRA